MNKKSLRSLVLRLAEYIDDYMFLGDEDPKLATDLQKALEAIKQEEQIELNQYQLRLDFPKKGKRK